MIPILLDDTKTLTALMSDNSNGLGKLSEIIEATVIEERNGEYDLTFTIPMNAKHFNDIHNGGIVRVKASEISGNQMFRIYKISKPMNGIVTVDAHHISYDLNKLAIKPFQATGIQSVINGLQTNSVVSYPFTMTTTLTNATSKFTLKEPMSFRGTLGGWSGSILDIFGGEYEFDNLRVKLLSHRGNDNGVTIRYGKNLVDLKQEENIDNTYTAVLGYVTNNEQTVVSDLQTAIVMTYPKVKIVDFSNEYDALPTKAQLNTKVQSYIQNNDIGKPTVNLDVSFVALWQTEEYKNIAPLERVSLCDTVTVEFPKLGVSSQAKVVRTEWNVLAERYNSIELGESRSSFAQSVTDTIMTDVEKQTSSWIDIAVENATELITGGLGGYVVIGRNASGEPEEILIMDRPTKESAINVIRMNQNGIGFSRTGYTGPFTSAWTIDGSFVADFITSGTLRAINIEGVNISGSNLRFGNEQYVQVRTNDSRTGVLFRGTGRIDYETSGAFLAKNFDSSGNRANTMNLFNSQTVSSTEMYNYFGGKTRNYFDIEYGTYDGTLRGIVAAANYQNNETLANRCYITHNITENYNRIRLINYKYNENLLIANSLSLMHNSTNSELQIDNQQFGNDNIANRISMNGYSDSNNMRIVNIISGTNRHANNVTLNYSDNSTLSMTNYSANGNVKNAITLSTNGGLTIRNNVGDTTTESNRISFTDSGLTISNRYGGQLFCGNNEAWLQYGARKLRFDSTSSTVGARGVQLANDAGGSNYVLLRDNGTMELWAANGIVIHQVDRINFRDGSSLP